ncbi:MAG: peptidoglycan editing factor PgeF [Gammaproteobacteria bacterium]|nr:peptidoglycan editing factor PgeF [Gammaproteobacteria bacterium]
MRYIVPNWPVPMSVKSYSSTRDGGVSSGPYTDLNLGDHVGDDPAIVDYNRQNFRRTVGLMNEPHWLTQVHGKEVKVIEQPYSEPVTADASVTSLKNQACVIMTADCLPILLCDKAGTVVAGVHAGWRGLVGGIIKASVLKMNCPPENLMAWLGPAISQRHFEVGPEVVKAFGADFGAAFKPSERPGHFMADIYQLARIQLNRLGISDIYGGDFCTYSDTRFFSYRRDNAVTGRMASLIWIGDR